PVPDLSKKVHKLLEEYAKLKSSGGGKPAADGIVWESKLPSDTPIQTPRGALFIEFKWAKAADADQLRSYSDRILDEKKKANVVLIGSGSGSYVLRTRPNEKGEVDARKIATAFKD